MFVRKKDLKYVVREAVREEFRAEIMEEVQRFRDFVETETNRFLYKVDAETMVDKIVERINKKQLKG